MYILYILYICNTAKIAMYVITHDDERVVRDTI